MEKQDSAARIAAVWEEGMSKTGKGHLLALMAVLVWGTTFISSKILLRSFATAEILFIRFVLGYLVLVLLCRKRIRAEGWKEERWYLLAGLSGVTLYYFLENQALVYTLASNVGVIVSSAPLFTVILAAIFLKEEKIGARFFAGFVCAMAGIVLISFQGGESVELNPKGDFLAVTAAFWWGIYSVVLRKISAYQRNTLAVTRRIFFWGVVFMIPMFLGTGDLKHFDRIFQPVNFGNLLFLGIGASALCFAAWNYAVEALGAVKSSVYIYLNPVTTLIGAYLILGERITTAGAIGTVLTFAGLALSEKKEKTKNHSEEEHRDGEKICI